MIETLQQFSQEHPAARNTLIATAAVAGGVALYKALKPEQHFEAGENYFDIIQGFNQTVVEAVGEEVGYVMMGGGASAALMDKNTVIDIENRRIIPPANIHKDQFRKKNGTIADIDVLVFTIDTQDPDDITDVDKVRAALEVSYGSKLKIGVTGLHAGENYDKRQASNTFLDHIKKDWVSDRLEYPDGTRYVAIGDQKVELPAEYFETWEMELLNKQTMEIETVPVFHPLLQVMCYLSRASHGVRPRDIEKVTDIMKNIGGKFGAELNWGKKNQTANIKHGPPPDDGVVEAIDFCDRKNNLRWRDTRRDLGISEAAWMATRIAIHRQLDTRAFFEQFGQGGWLFDHVISKFSGEKQQPIKLDVSKKVASSAA
jgi:hypothetical protein